MSSGAAGAAPIKPSEGDHKFSTTRQKPVVNEAALNMTQFIVFVEYVPASVREKVRHEVKYATHLFAYERHFEVMQRLDAVIEQCMNATKEVPTAVDGDIVVNRVRVITQGAAVPTLLSVRLFIRFIQTSPMYVTAKARSDACQLLLCDIADKAGWSTVSAEANGTGTFYRYDASSGNHYFKVIGDVRVNVIYVCGVIMELDLFSEWFPMCSSSHNQGDVSLFHKSSYFLVKAPWPVASREVFLHGYGVDDLDQNGRVVIVAHSLREDEDPLPPGIHAPPKRQGNVRCDVNYGGFEMKVVSPTETRLSFIMSIDPKIPNVPQSALNWVNAKILWQMVKEIQKAAIRSMAKDSKYYARRRERPEVYELFRSRYNDLLKARFSDQYDMYVLDADY